MFNCEASKQASGLGLMLSAKIYILSWKVWNKTFYCGSQTRIIADYTRNQIVFMRPLTYQNPVSKRVYFILWNKTSLNRRCVEHFEIDYYLIKRNTLVAWHLEIPRRWSKNEWQKRLLEGESVSHKTGNCKLWMNNSGDGSVEKKRSCQRCHQFWYGTVIAVSICKSYLIFTRPVYIWGGFVILNSLPSFISLHFSPQVYTNALCR